MTPDRAYEEEHKAAKSGRSCRPIVSRRLEDDSLIELVYEPRDRQTWLIRYQNDEWIKCASVKLDSGETLVPYSPDNNLITTAAVLLPSAPEDYASEAELVTDVTAFIHRYVDLSPIFEKIAAHYVLLSWVYDAFNELPYLRLQGDYGTGKTRALLTVGALCYKPFFASGASTVSPIFHTLDAFAGTLVIDEGDFRFSDEKADVVKILNNGNVRGIPVLRTMQNRQREFNPRAFSVFGPKIVATRGEYQDKALESRFITERMGGRTLRADIPINLDESFEAEALALRNQLLMYRFRWRHAVRANKTYLDVRLEARMNQVFIPLLSVIDDASVREEVAEIARAMQAERLSERGMSPEAQLLEVLQRLRSAAPAKPVSVRDITQSFAEAYGTEYARPITNRWIGALLRRLGLHTYKSHGFYLVPESDNERIDLLCERFGIDAVDQGNERAG